MTSKYYLLCKRGGWVWFAYHKPKSYLEVLEFKKVHILKYKGQRFPVKLTIVKEV